MKGKKETKKADKPRRKLALRKETLKDLTPGRAKDAKGGLGPVTPTLTCKGICDVIVKSVGCG